MNSICTTVVYRGDTGGKTIGHVSWEVARVSRSCF